MEPDEEDGKGLALQVIAGRDSISIHASAYESNFWLPHQDDSAWSMVLCPVGNIPGHYRVEPDDAYIELDGHPRYLHASRCIARLQVQFPRLTRRFDGENRLYIEIHNEDLLHFRMFWEMID
jgi:hypothetical protein